MLGFGKRWLAVAVCCGAVLVGRAHAQSLVLCARQKNDGTISTALKVRPACKPREVQLDPAALGLVGPEGPQGPVGPEGPQGPQGGELPWIDVKQYGATGDGTTDDTAAILAAIARRRAAALSSFRPATTASATSF